VVRDRRDGSQQALAIGAKGDPQPLLDQLRGLISDATFGYSEEIERQFEQSPSSLRASGA
jgi:hypothetical protein